MPNWHVNRPLSEDFVQWANDGVSSNCSFGSVELAIAVSHSRGGPPAKSCQVDFAPSTAQPVVYEAVSEHVGMEMDACLYTSGSYHSANSARG
jgi:hypothetical protein